jgi:hypothetical protein
VGEEHLRLTSGASAGKVDRFPVEACGEELVAVGLEKIGVQVPADSMEQIVRVRELGLEFREDLFPYGVAAGTDSGTYGDVEVLRVRSKLEAHPPNAVFDDAFHGSAPAGMEGGDDPAYGVGNKDGNTVGGLNSEQNSGLMGQNAVAFARWRRSLGGRVRLRNDKQAGVNLAQRSEGGGGVARDRFGEETAVANDMLALILSREAKIQLTCGVFGCVGAGDTALTAAEAMPEPGEAFPTGDGDKLDAVGSDYGLRGSGAEVARKTVLERGAVRMRG